MNAEELKSAVADYADEHLPGWEVASVNVRVGRLGENPPEVLLVTRDREIEPDILVQHVAEGDRERSPACQHQHPRRPV